MKLIRFGSPGNERPGLRLADGSEVDASAFGEDYDERFFGGDGLRRLSTWAEKHAATAPRIPDGSRFGPAIERPSKIICIGLNYRDHAAETNAKVPSEPIIFSKATSAWSGPYDDLVIPKDSTKTDWEVELAVVIGRRASYVTEAQAYEYIAGYGVLNDYSERAFQKEHGGQWVKGKSADSFAPFGPWLVTKDEAGDVGNLELWLDVNGERRQHGNTSNLIFGVPFLVSYLSRFMTLLPGDVISTGTPAGVGMGMVPPVYLTPGDVCTLGVAGLGEQRQVAVAYAGQS